MENKKLFISSLIVLLGVSSLTGCGETNVSTSSSQNQITSSSSNTLETEKSKLNEMINNLAKGFSINGTINEKLNILDGYHGDPIGETMYVTYDAKYIYQTGEQNAYSAYVTYEEEGYEKEEFIDLKVFEGEDRYAYYDELNYDNTVKYYPLYSLDSEEPVNFAYYCSNPFEFILPEDFTKIGDNKYELNKGKAAFLSTTLFGDIDGAFNGAVLSNEFVVENGNFKSFKLVPEKFHNSLTDYESLSAIYYYAEFDANFEFNQIGNAVVDPVSPKVGNEKTELLNKAFDKFQNKNFTAAMHIEYKNQDGELLGENFEYTYYDGEAIYMSFAEDQSEHDSLNNQYCAPNKDGILDGLGVTYSEAVPLISEVEAAIFDYNEETGLYDACDEVYSYIAALAFVPRVSNIGLLLDGYIDYFSLELDEDGNLVNIYFGYEYTYALSSEIGSVKLSYYDVDNTKIPHGFKSY